MKTIDITKLVGTLSIGALAMTGCKSSEPAPAPAPAAQTSCSGATTQPAATGTAPASGGTAPAAH